MAENKATETTEQATEDKSVTLESMLSLIEPEAVRNQFLEKLGGVAKLIHENNSRVAAIKEAKATDPNNTEHLDAVWHRVIAEKINDREIIEAERRFQKAEAEREKQLGILREAAKARHIRPPMSDEEIAKTRKLVNESKSVIADARKGAEAFAEMADTMLKLVGKEVEGGIITLLPKAESLLNTRGRKSSSSGGEKAYATRLVEAEIDGKSTNKMKKNKDGVMAPWAHFNNVAEELSKQFNSEGFPQNAVTPIEIEKAYYDSKDATFRESSEMPEDHTFTFTKDIAVQVPNSDDTKMEPHTKQIRIVRWTKDTAGLNEESAKAEGENANA